MSQTAEIILSKDQFNSLKNEIADIANQRVIRIIDEDTDYPVIRFYDDNDLMEELLRENDLWINVLFDAPSMDDTEF
jgi:hypothetical protein